MPSKKKKPDKSFEEWLIGWEKNIAGEKQKPVVQDKNTEEVKIMASKKETMPCGKSFYINSHDGCSGKPVNGKWLPPCLGECKRFVP